MDYRCTFSCIPYLRTCCIVALLNSKHSPLQICSKCHQDSSRWCYRRQQHKVSTHCSSQMSEVSTTDFCRCLWYRRQSYHQAEYCIFDTLAALISTQWPEELWKKEKSPAILSWLLMTQLIMCRAADVVDLVREKSLYNLREFYKKIEMAKI